ncbi:MAG TPA: aminotransferase, partial [Microbacterium sp.]|nr:aminotransferase [Microbacterium sp.]
GVTITPRGGTIRVSAHAGTDDESLSLLAATLSAYVAARAW